MTSQALPDAVEELSLVDHHSHGIVTRDLDDAAFDGLISEGGAPPAGTTNFDSPVGLAIRRHCAPVLDLEPHAPREAYLRRRRELGVTEVARRLLRPTRTVRYCVDTGFRAQELTTPEQLADLGGGRASHVVRLEVVAETLAAAGVDPGEFGVRFGERLCRTVTDVGAVGVKSIAAYRVGLYVDPAPPSETELARAAARWLRRGPDPNGVWRLDDRVLTRAILASAVDLGLPIQFHVGFGDADIRMHHVDPTLLTDWLRRHRVPVMLLHCWPYQRQAAFLAAVFPHVYLDVGLALPYVGPTRALDVLAEALEVTPFTKMLYSSDAYAVPELYYLAVASFRRALTQLLGKRVEDSEWSAPDGLRIAKLIGHDNAMRVYRFEA